jgi:hypothetical protein
MRALFYQRQRAWASLTLGTQSFLPSAAGNNPEPWFGLVSISCACTSFTTPLYSAITTHFLAALIGCLIWGTHSRHVLAENIAAVPL